MRCLARSLGLVVILLLAVTNAPRAQLRVLETEHLRLVYTAPIHSYLAPHVARCFENAYRFHEKFWDGPLDEKVLVLLHDQSDFGNAGAKNIPSNLIIVAIAPFSYVFETMPANERMNMLMNHELVHIYGMDRPSGGDRFYRGLFWGKPVATAENPLSILYNYLATPRRAAPRWYHEGIAVFLETWMGGGYGRALGAYDEMVFRAKVLEGAKFYDPVSLESEGTQIDFLVGVNSYLYGTRFSTYLALNHGPERFKQWISRRSGTKAYFGSQFKRAFGQSLGTEWGQWVKSEREFQEENLASIREYPITPYRDYTTRALGSVSRAFYDSTAGRIYAAVNFPGEIAHLAAIDLADGSIDKLKEIKGAALFHVTSPAYDESSGSLFYTTDNYGWRDLCVYNVRTGDSRTLVKDARVGDLVLNRADSSLWGIRHFNGFSTIARIPHPYTEWNKVYVWPYGLDMYDIDLSPDGRLLTGALVDVRGHQRLVMMRTDSLLAGDSTYSLVYDFGTSNPEGFVFSPDGRYLYGTSYYTGVSNVFRYDFETDSMQALTNTETGFFRPMPLPGDSILVFRFAAEGFVPAVIPEAPIYDINPIRYFGQQVVTKYPEVKDWAVPSPRTIGLDSLIIAEWDYRSLVNLGVTSVEPVVEGYKDHVAYGLRLTVGDPLIMHEGVTTVAYSPNPRVDEDERWHARWSHSYRGFDLGASFNATDFYDLFGPTKTSRKGYSFGVDHSRNLFRDDPRTIDLSLGVTRYGDLETLPDYQNIATSFEKFTSASAQIRFEDVRASLGAVDGERGMTAEAVVSGARVKGESFPEIHATLDVGVPLPIPHSSIWLRTAAGYAHGNRDEPLANFYFGGFGNNWVDHLTEKRYRKFYSFPGAELNAINGTDFAKAMVEWNLPPLRLGRFGTSSLYASWVRVALFSMGIMTNVDSPGWERRAASVGAQLDVRMQLLSSMKLTLSGGWAAAFERGRSATDEYLVSLKIL